MPFVAHASARQRALAEGSDQAGPKRRRPSEVSTNAIVHYPAARFPSLCPYRRLSLRESSVEWALLSLQRKATIAPRERLPSNQHFLTCQENEYEYRSAEYE